MSTFIAGQVLTAAELNAIFDPLSNVWSTYTPTLTGGAIGNGTLVARFMQTGKICFFHIRWLAGSTTTVTSTLVFTLPATGAASSNQQVPASCFNNTSNFAGLGQINASSAQITAYLPTASGNVALTQYAGTMVGAALAAGQILILNGHFETV